ncbi:MAG: ABC transporter permease [Oscillospiraceae bacterium]|nr:ABC transporter permease [Oscillospiraceae bacterium]
MKTKQSQAARIRRPSFFVTLFRRKKLGAFCMLYLLLMVLLAIFAGIISPYPMTNGMLPMDVLNALSNPSLSNGHLLGTDTLGRDVLSYLIYGARTSVILCLSCTVISTCISVLLGTLSAVIGGWFDLLVQRLVDAWSCIPSMLILLLLMSMLGQGMPQLVAAMALPAGIGGSRMVRSAALTVKGSGYVRASELLGGSILWKTVQHVVPNIFPLIITGMASNLGGVIMMEASLNFLGYGVDVGTPSWGYLITNQGRANLFTAPGLCMFPGIAIAAMVFASSMFGDAVRDILDPRIQGGDAPSYEQKKTGRLFRKELKKYAEKIKDLEALRSA